MTFEIQRTSADRTNLRAAEDDAALHSSALKDRDCPASEPGPVLGKPGPSATFSFSARDGKQFHGAASPRRKSSFPKMIELSQCLLVA